MAGELDDKYEKLLTQSFMSVFNGMKYGSRF